MKLTGKVCIANLLITMAFSTNLLAQELYTAKGYWTELNKEGYQKILKKQTQGDVLSEEETYFLQDYQDYLKRYYDRMSEDEKLKFVQMQAQWDSQTNAPADQAPEDFNLRTRDRLVNGLYGAYYGASLVAIFESESAGVIAGVPLIMAGVWQLGPVINKKKYEDISLATIRAGNSGKLLGLGYGAAAGLAIGGNSEDTYKWVLGLSTVGSIALGEIAFQTQKNRQLSEGHVDIMRLYGFLGPTVTGLGIISANVENANLVGASLLAGGIAGLFIGNGVAKKYDYTSGAVDAIRSLTLISAGLGATIAVGTIESGENTGLFLIPAATAVAGTLYGQKSVKGVKLSKRQGSTINLASGGAALIGLGVVALTEAETPAWWVGVPSALALVMHQSLFHSYRKKNLEGNFNFGKSNEKRAQFSMKVTPENFFTNKYYSERLFAINPNNTYPIVNMKLVF